MDKNSTAKTPETKMMVVVLKQEQKAQPTLTDNNRLFTMRQFIRAGRAYKDVRIHSFYQTRTCAGMHACTHVRTHARMHAHTHTHTHTHMLQIHALLVMGWYNENAFEVINILLIVV